MSVTDYKFPNVAVEDTSIGIAGWSAIDNVKAEDTDYSTDEHYVLKEADIAGYQAKIVKGGTITGNAVIDSFGYSYTPVTTVFGGGEDTWGTTFTANDINNSGFGFAIAYSIILSDDYTYYLKVSDFGFEIPGSATVDGIEVSVRHFNEVFEYGSLAKVESIKARVYYTESSGPVVGTKYHLPAFVMS